MKKQSMYLASIFLISTTVVTNQALAQKGPGGRGKPDQKTMECAQKAIDESGLGINLGRQAMRELMQDEKAKKIFHQCMGINENSLTKFGK